jgi:hypothetical protein
MPVSHGSGAERLPTRHLRRTTEFAGLPPLTLGARRVAVIRYRDRHQTSSA